MSHTKEQIAAWIVSQWADDYYRFDDIRADFKVLEFERTANSLWVRCSFVGDETRKGVDWNNLVMFRYDPVNHIGFFPSQLQIVNLEDKYIWDDSDGCDVLADGYDMDPIDYDVTYVGWDDPKLSDEVIKKLVADSDHWAIAETLINLYDAKSKMPDFVPARLKPYFIKIINDFKPE
jgi:hypothetical protein